MEETVVNDAWHLKTERLWNFLLFSGGGALSAESCSRSCLVAGQHDASLAELLTFVAT